MVCGGRQKAGGGGCTPPRTARPDTPPIMYHYQKYGAPALDNAMLIWVWPPGVLGEWGELETRCGRGRLGLDGSGVLWVLTGL